MNSLFAIVKQSVHNKIPTFRRIEDLVRCVGFRSVYFFNIEEVKSIQTRGHLGGLRNKIPVVARDLLIDFDDKPDNAAAFKTWLQSHYITFTQYHSGRRSIHFHVSIVPIEGIHVPYSQRSWLQANPAAKGCDLSFYHTVGLFRLPGTEHEKNKGATKTVMDSQIGQLLRIPYREPPIIEPVPPNISPEEEAMRNLRRVLARYVEPGNGRHVHVATITTAAVRCGWLPSQIYEAALHWNQYYTWGYPLPVEEVVRKVDERYDYLIRERQL